METSYALTGPKYPLTDNNYSNQGLAFSSLGSGLSYPSSPNNVLKNASMDSVDNSSLYGLTSFNTDPITGEMPTIPSMAATTDTGFNFNNLLKDKYMMGNITGLASTLLQAASLPTMLENARLQNKSLKFNLDTAREEQARRNKNIEAFNSFRA